MKQRIFEWLADKILRRYELIVKINGATIYRENLSTHIGRCAVFRCGATFVTDGGAKNWEIKVRAKQ